MRGFSATGWKNKNTRIHSGRSQQEWVGVFFTFRRKKTMLGKQYLKYVSSNILGMMGLSFYISSRHLLCGGKTGGRWSGGTEHCYSGVFSGQCHRADGGHGRRCAVYHCPITGTEKTGPRNIHQNHAHRLVFRRHLSLDGHFSGNTFCVPFRVQKEKSCP